jgi:hypothetical protein
MLSALVLAAAAATATPPATGVSGKAHPSNATSGATHSFSGGNVQPIGPSSNPLLEKAAPKPNVHATAGPLLRKAAPGASANPHALRQFSGAYTQNGAPGAGNQGGKWGWAGLFGVLGLFGLWRAPR